MLVEVSERGGLEIIKDAKTLARNRRLSVLTESSSENGKKEV